VNGIYSFVITLIAIVSTLLVARVSWTYFEKRLVRIGHRTDYKFVLSAQDGALAVRQYGGH